MPPLPPFRLRWTLLLLAVTAAASAATLPVAGYRLQVWQTEDGLPENAVTCGVQTRDGFLWFGTRNGLCRFDGERFEVFDPAHTPGLAERAVSQLFEDAAGTLWIGYDSGALAAYRHGRFAPFRPPGAPGHEKIIGLGTDEAGRSWAMSDGGSLAALDSDRRADSLIAPDHPGVMAFTRGPDGAIWVAENGRAARLVDGRLTIVALPPPRLANYVLGIAASAHGGAWILADHRIRRWRDGRWTEDRGEPPWQDQPLSCALELRDGTLAVGTIYSGVYLIFGDGRPPVHFDRSTGLPQNWVRFLYEDREANLWVGAGSAGLACLHASAFSVANPPDQWRGCSVLSVAADPDGGLWIGTDGAGVFHHAGGEWRQYGESDGLHNWYIPAIAVSPQGEVWAGENWWGGPRRLEHGRFVAAAGIDARSPQVRALWCGDAGELLVGGHDGSLVQLQDGRAASLVPPSGATADACALARTTDGALWCGFAQGGLARLAPGHITRFHPADGLPSDAIECLLADADGSLWIGTADRGVVRYKDGRFATLGVAQGLVDQGVTFLLDDGLGFLWLATYHGLQRVAKAELNRCADRVIPTVSGQVYNTSDGLPTSEFTGGLQASGCRTADGRLWFATSKGLVSVNPRALRANPTPPPVVLKSLELDGTPLPVAARAVVRPLPPHHERLEFHYAGLSYVAPDKVRFKYRLDGIDGDWIDAGTRRIAFYSRLPAGTYRFRVIASNNDGVWNTAGAAVTFTVSPFFWDTWWFRGGVIVLLLVLAALAARQVTRRRLQRRLDALERQHAVERERARIAQDIHDDIGTSLTRIAMFTQQGGGELADPQQAAAVLGRIHATAQEMTRALDEIVWAVDPRHDTLDGLATYLGRFAQELLGAAHLRCRLDFPVDLPDWRLTAEQRHQLFLAFKESLHNVVKHAAATEVRIGLQVRDHEFALRVADDGRGLDPRPAGSTSPGRIASGNGLRNLERRLARLGGRCELASTPGAGTVITFTVPLAPSRSQPTASSAS